MTTKSADHILNAPAQSAFLAGPQLIHQLFYFLDESQYPELVGLFTEQGWWQRQGELLTGHAQIMQALNKRSTTQRIRHVISNAFVVNAPDGTVSLTAYMTAYRFDDGRRHEGSVGISRPFRLSVVKAGLQAVEERWLISSLDLVPEFEFIADTAAPAAQA